MVNPQYTKIVEDENLTRLIELYQELSQVNPDLAKGLLKVDLKMVGTTLERTKSQRYGESYSILGLQGILFQILHKAERLKNSITDENKNFTFTEGQMLNGLKLTQDSLPDQGVISHLLDLGNYCKLALGYIYRRLNEKVK